MVGWGRRARKFWDFIPSRLAKIASPKDNFKEYEMKWREVLVYFQAIKDYPFELYIVYSTIHQVNTDNSWREFTALRNIETEQFNFTCTLKARTMR